MHILEELFFGQVNMSDRISRPGSEYRRLADRLCAEYEQLSAELSAEAQIHFNAFDQIKGDMNAIEVEDAFIEGFRLGARIILAVTSDYQGQFQPSHLRENPAKFHTKP